MNLGKIRVYTTSWWDVDHHIYGCPIEILIHTERHFINIRPFCRRWYFNHQSPEIWGILSDRSPAPTHHCTWCLHDTETCEGIGCRRPHHVRFAVFPRHVWRCHIRHRTCWPVSTRRKVLD